MYPFVGVAHAIACVDQALASDGFTISKVSNSGDGRDAGGLPSICDHCPTCTPSDAAAVEADNALGSGPYKGTRSVETTLQLRQIVELGGKREARIAAGETGIGVVVR